MSIGETDSITMARRFLIVTRNPAGSIEIHAMKKWLREHPDQMPADFTPLHKTSHQIRNELKRMGWLVEETDEEVRLMRAEIAADPSATSMLDEASPEMAADDEFAFALEAHLRDFIAHNLATLPLTHKNLRLYTDDQLRKGIEYPTEVGPVDILAVDEQGNFIVFELKLTEGPR